MFHSSSHFINKLPRTFAVHTRASIRLSLEQIDIARNQAFNEPILVCANICETSACGGSKYERILALVSKSQNSISTNAVYNYAHPGVYTEIEIHLKKNNLEHVDEKFINTVSLILRLEDVLPSTA